MSIAIYNKPLNFKPSIMSVDLGRINCFDVSPSDFLSANKRDGTLDKTSEKKEEYLTAHESPMRMPATFPTVNNIKLKLKRSNSWSYLLSQ